MDTWVEVSCKTLVATNTLMHCTPETQMTVALCVLFKCFCVFSFISHCDIIMTSFLLID